MYRITKLTLRHSNDANPILSPIAVVNCSYDELITKVLPKLKKLSASENVAFRFVGSSTRIQYMIKEIEGITLTHLMTTIDNLITHNVASHNAKIDQHNKFVRRNNKKLYKPQDEGISFGIKLSDYLSPFNRETTYSKVNGLITVSEADLDVCITV